MEEADDRGWIQRFGRRRARHGLGDRVDSHPGRAALGSFGTGWIMVAITFGWVALTAAGPFIFLERRFARRIPQLPADRRPPLGDAGYPVARAPRLVQSAAPSSEPRHNPLVCD